MITIIPTNEVEQGTPKWLELRSKYVTATDCYDLIKGTPISELLARKTNNSFKGNYYTQRGHDLEPYAKYVYSQLYQPVTDAGFIINDLYPNAGYSPDGLVADNGLVEVKCFNVKRHLDVYQNLDPHIICQIQFGLLISGRDWCDLVLYNPDIDDAHQAFLTKRLLPSAEMHNKIKLALKGTL